MRQPSGKHHGGKTMWTVKVKINDTIPYPVFLMQIVIV